MSILWDSWSFGSGIWDLFRTGWWSRGAVERQRSGDVDPSNPMYGRQRINRQARELLDILESNELRKWQKLQNGIPFDPLVLDLNRDGQINLQNATFFDFDANGFHELAAWIDKGDAFLVLDKNFNGIIDNGSEMFGDAMILPDGSRALSGFQALRAFNSNGDGRIDINDDIFSSLKLLTGAGYLVSLADAGIKSITLPSTASVRGSKIFSLSFYGASRWVSSDIADRHRKSA